LPWDEERRKHSKFFVSEEGMDITASFGEWIRRRREQAVVPATG
jgi:hypothetical protein